MNHNEHLAAILSEGRTLISACDTAPDGEVAACPGWTNTELLGHILNVWGFVATQVRAADTSGPSRPDPVDADESSDLLNDLISVLESTDASQPAWNWSPDTTVGFWVRRMACETAIHRWDAEDAAGATSPIESGLAVEVVDEAVNVVFRFQRGGPVVDHPSGSLHLHATDCDGEWLVVPGDAGLVVTREHAKADTAAAGTASDLALFVWGRGGNDLQFWGDEAELEAWASVAP
ncbi:MAG: hypothetical protein MAG471_00574 [Acidimicrobiaceae bacterium]|nr:hypothetical protein [Acidimicrobiaceae bacterium]